MGWRVELERRNSMPPEPMVALVRAAEAMYGAVTMAFFCGIQARGAMLTGSSRLSSQTMTFTCSSYCFEADRHR